MGIKKTRGRKRKSIQKRRSRKQQKKRGTLRKKNRSRKRAGGWPWSNSEEARLKKQAEKEAKEDLRYYQTIEDRIENSIARESRRRAANAAGVKAYNASNYIDNHGGASTWRRHRNRKNAYRNAQINFYKKNPPNPDSWIDRGLTAEYAILSHDRINNPSWQEKNPEINIPDIAKGWTPENVKDAMAIPTTLQTDYDEIRAAVRAANEDN